MLRRVYRHPNGDIEVVTPVAGEVTAYAFYEQAGLEVITNISPADQPTLRKGQKYGLDVQGRLVAVDLPPAPLTPLEKLLDGLEAKGVLSAAERDAVQVKRERRGG